MITKRIVHSRLILNYFEEDPVELFKEFTFYALNKGGLWNSYFHDKIGLYLIML